jgi:hypothetical protein
VGIERGETSAQARCLSDNLLIIAACRESGQIGGTACAAGAFPDRTPHRGSRDAAGTGIDLLETSFQGGCYQYLP